MSRFRFRLQRVLEYRTSLVEAQEAELGRRALLLRSAQEERANVETRQQGLIEDMTAMSAGPVRPERSKAAWDYWEQLRQQHEHSEQAVCARQTEVDEARTKLTDLRKGEKVMEKLKERQRARADVEERRQEVKELDDLTTTRFGHAYGEASTK